jgi:hypothetical protein
MLNSCRRVALGVLLGGALAVASALPAFAAPKPVAPTANAIRHAGGEAVINVDGRLVAAGQVTKGRNVEARVYVPANVRFTRPVSVFLADYQTTSFDLARSNQRLLQATSARLVPGRWTVLKLELHCTLTVARCRTHTSKHQLDVGVGSPIGQQYQWLGSYPRYSGKQLLTSTNVKARCKPAGHHKPRKPRCRCHGTVAVAARSWG